MAERPHYHGHRQRLRERLLKDPRALADYEILELLLAQVLPRRDTKPLAKELLQRHKTLRGVLQADTQELREAKGFADSLESYWLLLRELRARFDESVVLTREPLDSPQAVGKAAIARLGESKSEEFWLALLDNMNRLLGWERLSKGTVNHAPVYPREVLSSALMRKAAGFIMVHNHPSGELKPSAQDIEITRRISRGASDLGIRLLDHLIVNERDYFSFKDHDII